MLGIEGHDKNSERVSGYKNVHPVVAAVAGADGSVDGWLERRRRDSFSASQVRLFSLFFGSWCQSFGQKKRAVCLLQQ